MRTIQYAILEEARNHRPTPQTILDVGCGDGSFTRVVADTFSRTSVTAIDTTLKKISTSHHISYFTGEVENLPFASESFDMVVAALSMHHWTDKEKGVREIYRVLKKNGKLIIGDPLLEDWMSNRFLGWLMQVMDGGIFADEKEIRDYFETAGFQDVDISLIPNTMKSLYLITARK